MLEEKEIKQIVYHCQEFARLGLLFFFFLTSLDLIGQYENWDLSEPFETKWFKQYNDTSIENFTLPYFENQATITISRSESNVLYGTFQNLKYPIKEYGDKRMMTPFFLIDADLFGEFKIEKIESGYKVTVRHILSHNNQGTEVYVGAGVSQSLEGTDPLEDYIYSKNRQLKKGFAKSILPRLDRLFSDTFDLGKAKQKDEDW